MLFLNMVCLTVALPNNGMAGTSIGTRLTSAKITTTELETYFSLSKFRPSSNAAFHNMDATICVTS
jgi:hypothetical protein